MEWFKRNYLTIILLLLTVGSLVFNAYLYHRQNNLMIYIGGKIDPELEDLQRQVSRNRLSIVDQESRINENESAINTNAYNLNYFKSKTNNRLDHQEYIETKRSYQTGNWY